MYVGMSAEGISLDRERELPQLKGKVYLDNAAAGLPLSSHLNSYTSDLTTHMYGNPHSLHSASKLTCKVISCVRDEIAQFLNTDLTQYSVLFTSGTTGGCRLLAEAFCWGGDPGEGERGGAHVYLNSEQGEYMQSCQRIQKAVDKNHSCFLYLEPSHTSVVGMREVAQGEGALSVCVREEDLFGCVPSDLQPCPLVQGEEYIPTGPDNNIPKIFKGITSAEIAQETFMSFSSDRLARKEGLRAKGYHLLAYPATCNFSGRRYPIGAIEQIVRSGLKLSDVTFPPDSVKVFIDAAAALSTSEIDLSRDTPHFLAVSFYKLFGFPTGIGALLVRNDSCHLLDKKYFGGGTVWSYLSRHSFHLRKEIPEFFEEGTVSYQSIFALHHGFQTLRSLGLSIRGISSHTFSLTEYTHSRLSSLQHYNGSQVCELYASCPPLQPETQGAILSFNVKRSDGSYVGYTTLNKLAKSNGICVGVGCFCNVGAIQKYLKLNDEDMFRFLEVGHTCGDNVSLVGGVPTGAVRVSFGFYNTVGDADRLIEMVERNFLECNPPVSLVDEIKPVSKHEPIVLRDINVYPIKSCAGFRVEKWPVCERGFLYDRVWAIKDSRNVIMKQTMDKNFYKIQPAIDLESDVMHINYPGMQPISFKIAKDGQHTQLHMIRVYGVRVRAAASPQEVNDWLSQALGYPVQLVQQVSDRYATFKPKHMQAEKLPMQLQLKTHVLLLTQQSADRVIKLATSSADSYNESAGEFIDRMRGNLVVDGKGLEPFAEHNWQRVSINEVTMHLVGDCERCEVINIHATDLSVSEVPMRFLVKERQSVFGILLYLDIQAGKQLPLLSVGDTLLISLTDE